MRVRPSIVVTMDGADQPNDQPSQSNARGGTPPAGRANAGDGTPSAGRENAGDGTPSAGRDNAGDGTPSAGRDNAGDGTPSAGRDNTGDGTPSAGRDNAGDGTPSAGCVNAGDGTSSAICDNSRDGPIRAGRVHIMVPNGDVRGGARVISARGMYEGYHNQAYEPSSSEEGSDDEAVGPGDNEDLNSEEDGDRGINEGMKTPTFSLGRSPPPVLIVEQGDPQLGLPGGNLNIPSILADDLELHTGPGQQHGRPTTSNSDLLYGAGSMNDEVREHMRHLVRRFSMRATRVKSSLDDPVSPPSTGGSRKSDGPAPEPPPLREAEDEEPPPPPAASDSPEQTEADKEEPKKPNLCDQLGNIKHTLFQRPINPQSIISMVWLGLISLVIMYNVWTIPLRASFPLFTPDNALLWYVFDYGGDLLFLVDTVLYKPRVMFYRDGFWVSDVSAIRRSYIRTSRFMLDVLAMVPLDLVFFFWDHQAILRVNRLLKLQTYDLFLERLDTVLASPHYVRGARNVFYMVLLVHLNACAYYAVSYSEGIGSNSWVYSGVGNSYVHCFYFATKTAISIGKNPKPVTILEHVFMTFSWLLGVFIFAVFLGQIRDIVGQMQEKDEAFRSILENTVEYMRRLNLPVELQERIKLWLRYTWQQQKSLNELKALEVLPQKMQTDIALDIHGATLKKVQMFRDCDEGLLRDLVLKLKPINYLPGDFVCKKGEVGREMYIIQAGQVMVMGGPDGNIVLATLQQGSVFGEISLLGLAGLDRRTADVRSRGFSTLFVLDKSDLQEAISSYPDAQRMMQQRARVLLKKNADLDKKRKLEDKENIIIDHSRPGSPQLLKALFKLIDPNSKTARLLRAGRKVRSQMELRVPSDNGYITSVSPLSLPPRLNSTALHHKHHNNHIDDSDQISSLSPSSYQPTPSRLKVFSSNSSWFQHSSSDGGEYSSTLPPGDTPFGRDSSTPTDSSSGADGADTAAAIYRMPREPRVPPARSVFTCSALVHREQTPSTILAVDEQEMPEGGDDGMEATADRIGKEGIGGGNDGREQGAGGRNCSGKEGARSRNGSGRGGRECSGSSMSRVES